MHWRPRRFLLEEEKEEQNSLGLAFFGLLKQ